ncbi:MAG: TonB-dependent receptor plug domain-containing protein [Verrucomicrobiota bacterium]
MKHINSTLVLSAALVASLSAQNNNELPVYELSPVIVTGDIWESELQKTTASVSVLGEETLKSNGTQHFEDVINSIPNVTWTGGTSRPRYIQIRGIGENSQFEGETPDSTVRFLIDEFDLTGVGTVGNLFDVQQVEVLRGPQAGAFGANAAGGVVQIVSNGPTAYWTGQAEATLGNDDLFAFGLAFGGPLIESDPEQLTFRFSINSLNQDGFRENQFFGIDDSNERDELTSRLKVRWKPNELWQIEGGLLYADADNGYDEFTLSNEQTKTFSDFPGRDEQETAGLSLKASYLGLDDVEITHTSTYIETDSFYSFDGDWSNPTLTLNVDYFYDGFLELERDREVFTQELRFDSSATEDALGFIDRWTLGAYYQSFEESTATTGFGDFATEYESETLSFYGQGTHLISETTRIILGLRAEYYDLETEMDFRPDVDFDDWLFGAKLTLEHDLSKDQTVFASITRGYKAGGANVYPFLEVPPFPEEYDTENLWNYELGLRSAWLDGKLRSSITLFVLDRDQAQLRDSEGEGIGFTYFTTNGEGAIHYGLEAEATYYIDENWSITTTLGLLETERDSYLIDVFDEDLDPGLDPDNDNDIVQEFIDERDLANAPSYTYSARIDYLPADGFFASAEIVASDDYFESNSHNEKRDAYTVVNASIGYRYENWTVTLWSKNLFDEEYAERVFFFNNTDFVSPPSRFEAPAAPQTFGITANYSW